MSNNWVLSKNATIRPDKGYIARGPRKKSPIRQNAIEQDGVKGDGSKHKQFVPYKVEFIMKDILETRLKHIKYNPHLCSRLAQDICVVIKEKTKDLELPRYKLITQVMVGQDTDQNVQVASRCLWNHSTDNFAAATFRNSSIYAVGIVYGMYLD